MIWLPGVISRDDITDDHIDGMVRFVAPGKVVLNIDPNSTATDPFSCNVRVVKAMLESATDSKGRSLDVVVLPPPDLRRTRCQNKDLLLSYCNFLVVNGAVINVGFGDAVADDQARQLLESVYPGRVVEMIQLDHLYCCGGGIHCVTQHQPKSR
jgi:agmatine deiminase